MPVNDEVDDSTHDNLEAALEDYDRESVATDAAEWVEQAPAPVSEPDDSTTFELYEDDDGLWRWRLVTENEGIVAISETGYHEKEAVQNAVSTFKEVIENAPVVAVAS